MSIVLSRVTWSMLFIITAFSARAAEPLNKNHSQRILQKPQIQLERNNSTEHTKDWVFTLGGGAGFFSKYEGSDKTNTSFLPVINATYQDFISLGLDGLQVRLAGDDETFRIGAGLGYTSGRKEKDDRKNLRGLGDLEDSALASLSGEYTAWDFLTFSTNITSALSGDAGTTVDFGVGSGYPLAEDVIFNASVGATWADGEHMRNNFGVSSKQSVASGKKRFTAESGIKSVTGTVGLSYLYSENISVDAVIAATELQGDAADSPIVRESFQPTGALTVSYRF